jgi:hypothetical protein
VLLTRGRDGFFIFIPKEVGIETTYAALVGAGVREMISLENIGITSSKKLVEG